MNKSNRLSDAPKSLAEILELNKQRKPPSNRWNGGIKRSNGYVYIYYPEYPKARIDDYVKRSTLIMEEHLGKYLIDDEDTHHINEIKDDDRLENLQVMTHSQHLSHHHTGKNVSDVSKQKMSDSAKISNRKRLRDEQGRFIGVKTNAKSNRC